MATMTVFVVFGSTGEYSDRAEWPVRGFTSKEKAEAFEFAATKWAHDFKKRLDEHDCDECYTLAEANYDKCPKKEKPAHDPSFRIDYTGTDYYTVTVEVES